MAIRRALDQRTKAARWEGIPELQRKIGAIKTKLQAQNLKKIFMRGALLLRDEARRLAPYDPKRKKGIHLRDAIIAAYGDPNKSDVLVAVSYRKAPHAALVEYGTSKMQKHPYMRPALAAMRAQVAKVVADGMRQFIDEVVAAA